MTQIEGDIIMFLHNFSLKNKRSPERKEIRIKSGKRTVSYDELWDNFRQMEKSSLIVHDRVPTDREFCGIQLCDHYFSPNMENRAVREFVKKNTK